MIACCTPSFIFITDPCDVNQLANGTQYRAANCASILKTLGINPTTYTDPNQTSVGGIDGGNAHLKQESARSWTAGVVLHPRFAPDLAFSIDSYDIRIDNAINTADAQTLADNCVDQPTIDNIFCAALRRNSTTGGINFFTVRPENVTNFHTTGFDFNLNYAPLWQGSFDLTWTRGPITAAHMYSYFSRTARYTLNTLAGDPDIATPYNYYQARRLQDLQVDYDLREHLSVYVGVNNLSNQKLDLDINYPVSPVGRFVYGGVKLSLGAR